MYIIRVIYCSYKMKAYMNLIKLKQVTTTFLHTKDINALYKNIYN